MIRTLRAAVAALLIAVGLSAVGAAAPAQAAYSNCNGTSYAYNIYSTSSSKVRALLPALNGNTNNYCELGSWLGGTYNSGTQALQRALNACYSQGLVADGYYGPKTVAAVKRVQAAIGVRADGGYGPVTKRAMNWPMYADGRGYGCVRGASLNDA